MPSRDVTACVTDAEPSATPVTVNDCGTLQSAAVNTSGADTVTLSGSPLVAVTVTSAVGAVANTAE